MSKIKNLESNEVHVLQGTKTGCGCYITENPKNWEYVSDSYDVTCEKNGCKDK